MIVFKNLFTRIDRYILLFFLRVYLGSISLFYLIFVIVKLTENLTAFIRYASRLTYTEIVLYFVYEFPLMFIYFSPIAGLFSIVFVFSRLNGQNETLAIYNTGYSPLRMVAPILVGAFIICVLFTAFEHSFVYNFHHKHRHLNNVLTARTPQSLWNRYRLTVFGEENKIYFISKFDAKESEIDNTQIVYLKPDLKNIDKIVSVEKATYNVVEDAWLAKNVAVRTWGDDKKIAKTEFYSELSLSLSEKPYHFQKQSESIEHLSAKETKREAQKIAVIGGDYKKYMADYYFKMATYFMSLFIIFLGVPIAGISRGSNILFSLIVVLFIVMGYFILGYIGNSLGKIGVLPPLLSGWMSNIICGFLIYFFWKRRGFI